MREAGGEVPEISRGDVVDKHLSVGLHHANARLARQHDGPLVGQVPVQFAEGPRFQPHVHAGQILRRRQLAGGDLVRPPAGLQPFRRQVVGVPQRTGVAGIGKRRHVRIGVLLENRRVFRTGVRRHVAFLPPRQRLLAALGDGAGGHKTSSCHGCRPNEHAARHRFLLSDNVLRMEVAGFFVAVNCHDGSPAVGGMDLIVPS